jgi:hypothetical protein
MNILDFFISVLDIVYPLSDDIFEFYSNTKILFHVN